MDENLYKIEQSNNKTRKKVLNMLMVFGVVALFIYYFLSAPFGNEDVVIHIPRGESISKITLDLENKNAVRNNFTLKVFIKLFNFGSGIKTGDYLIFKNSPVWVVAWQVTRGHHNIEPIKVTIREGLTNEEIASLLAEKIAGFRKDLFMSDVNDKQGYLFPDTYFFFPLDETDEIINKLSGNFNIRIEKLSSQIEKSHKSLKDIVIMASVLEGEAGGKEDIAMISGILWKRISVGMPLQVDIDKSTYMNKGLPVTPLSNPGLLSIEASLNPKNSPYLYYIHDKSGKVHFAMTFEEHKRNISNYLK